MAPEERMKEYVPGKYVRESMIVRRGIGTSAKNNSSTVMRLVIMFVLIGLLIWWVLGTDFFNDFFEKWLAK